MHCLWQGVCLHVTCLPLFADVSMQWLHVKIACVVNHTPGDKPYDQFYARPSSDCSRNPSKSWTLYQAQCIPCKKRAENGTCWFCQCTQPCCDWWVRACWDPLFTHVFQHSCQGAWCLHLPILYAPVHIYMPKQACSFDPKTCMISTMTRQEFTMLFFVPELVHALFCCHYSGGVCVCV